MATSIGVMANQAGMVLGFIVGPYIISEAVEEEINLFKSV